MLNMNFMKFIFIAVLLCSTCSVFQATESNPGIHVNHERWLQYSRALSSSLSNDEAPNLRDPINVVNGNIPSCVDGAECPSSDDDARKSHSEEAETPMSVLILNLTDIEIPFRVVKDVLHLEQRDENKGNFISEKAVIFSFVNKTVLRNINNEETVEPDYDPMIIALFLPVQYRFKHAGQPVPKAPNPENDSEWPQFFKNLLGEMAHSNVTSQNLMQALMSAVGKPSDEKPDLDATKKIEYEEALKLIKDHAFQDTDVMLYSFRTPHVKIPSKYVKKVLKDAEVPLSSNAEAKLEINEVYLMTVANETAGKALKNQLDHEDTHAVSSPPVVLSFIIPIEFNSERRVRNLPRAKLTNSPPQFISSKMDNPAIGNRVPLALVPAFSTPSMQFVPLPFYFEPDIDTELLPDLEPEEYLDNGDQEQFIRPTGSITSLGRESETQTQRVENPVGIRKPVIAAPVHASESTYEFQSQKAPPVSAPAGIASALQP